MASIDASEATPCSSEQGTGDEFSWEAYFVRTGSLAVDIGAFYHVECGHQQLAVSDAVEAESNATKVAVNWIETERFVDVQDELDPRRVWPAEILEHVGGRLLLKYVCLQDSGPPFWEFYLSDRVHPAGVCETEVGKQRDLHYSLPGTCDSADLVISRDVVDELLAITTQHTLHPSLFQPRANLTTHQFELGMWLEALDPLGASILYPAQVVEVLNNYYFVIEYDTFMITERTEKKTDRLRRACHARTPGLFPIGFAGRRGLTFAAPENFDWAAYLRTKGGKMAMERYFPEVQSDQRFIPGRRLEAVNPSAAHQICAATVIRVVDNMLWLHFDSTTYLTQTFVTDCNSMNLFPCGWCNANSYPLKIPYEHSLKDFTAAQEKLQNSLKSYTLDQALPCASAGSEERAYMPLSYLPGAGCPWSPAIYINSYCFTGPYIDRERLSMKSCQIGPGPMRLVMKTVADSVISSAFRPREVLAELETVFGCENVWFQPMEIKAKHRSKRWKGSIECCVSCQHVPEWCHQLCIRLEACPGLLAFKPSFSEKCPFDCNRAARTRRLGLAKPLSGSAAIRLKKRLAVQEKRREAAGENGQLHSRKRSRQMTLASSNSPSQEAVNRPVTRAAKRKTSAAVGSHNSGHRNGETSSLSRSNTANGNCSDDDIPSGSGSTSASSTTTGWRELSGSYPCSCFCRYCGDRRASSPSSDFERGMCAGDCRLDQGAIASRASPLNVTFSLPNVDSNPLIWTPNQLHQWLQKTIIGVGVADQLREELVDGQAFMLMDMRDVQEYLGLKLGPALKVCGVIKELKTLYLETYAAELEAQEQKFECSTHGVGCRCVLGNAMDLSEK